MWRPLATTVTLPNGVAVGVERPWLLLALPLAVVALWWLIYRGRAADGTDAAHSTDTASGRSRRYLFAARLVVVTLVVTAAAGPVTVVTAETTGDPHVSLLVDRSNSTAVTSTDAEALAAAIEREGVPVTLSTIARGTDSRIGEGVAANLRPNGSVVVMSDGRVTGGQRLGETAELARSIGATISTVSTEPTRTERHVSLAGPAKTSVGVESQFLVTISGVRADGTVPVTVRIDGETVATESVSGSDGRLEVSHTFESTGAHRLVAQIENDDVYEENDVARKTVRVVEQPRILYVSRGDHPLEAYLSELYDVRTADSVPSNLEPYYAVVVQDVAAGDVGNVEALQRFVVNGNGLFLVGGSNSFESGGYDQSALASMLPVTVGESSVGSARIVLLVDVSGSAGGGMRVQKATALSALDQLGNEHVVGIVGFNHEAYAVAEPVALGGNRAMLEDRIRRLSAGGRTDIANALQGAEAMLGEGRGTVILISDGRDTDSPSGAVAANLGQRGIRVISVGAGSSIDESVLRTIAGESGGQYFRATETNRLRLLFGGASRRYSGEGLTVVDSGHFVTAGVELESNPGRTNDVSIRPGADFLVAAEDGTPAVASWRYGLGRVVTITTFDEGGGLDGLLQRPDSLLVTKSANYAIGDPERRQTGVTDVRDTRVGEPTVVTYRGESPPSETDLDFRSVEAGRYQAEVTPQSVGFHTAAGATYAANYPAEYAAFGQDPALADAVETTGGQEFAPDDAAAIASFARQQSTRVREVRTNWAWLLLTLALLGYFAEVVVRRLQVYYGRTRHESGLP